jgi:hypothetical protein
MDKDSLEKKDPLGEVTDKNSGDVVDADSHTPASTRDKNAAPEEEAKDSAGSFTSDFDRIREEATKNARFPREQQARASLQAVIDKGMHTGSVSFFKDQHPTRKNPAATIEAGVPKEDKNALCPKCNKPAPHKCSKCLAVCYCSRECQLSHWPEHKTHCKRKVRLSQLVVDTVSRGKYVEVTIV